MKKIFKAITPPIFVNIINKITKRNICWDDECISWEKAQLQCRGYNPDIYLDKLLKAVRIVKDNEYMCERDSILFDTIVYPYPLLSGLFASTVYFRAQSLYILDFGGSLGSLYFQNRKYLRLLPSFTWNILEQDRIIEVGKKEFQTQELLFHANFEDAFLHIKPQDSKILILSSVLQYLEDPYKILDSLIRKFDFDTIIIDRTPFSQDNKHHIVIQKVPKKIYDTEYPSHLFQKQKIINFMKEKKYNLIDQFESYCDAKNDKIIHLGFLFFKQ